MRCPYLEKTEDLEGAQECHARESIFEPGFLEIDQYCTSPLHKWCPLYRAMRATPAVYRAVKMRREPQQAIG